jgi:hypothetical protein
MATEAVVLALVDDLVQQPNERPGGSTVAWGPGVGLARLIASAVLATSTALAAGHRPIDEQEDDRADDRS